MFYRWCFYLFYFLFQHEISEMCQPIGAKFCTVVIPRHNFIMPVQNFGCLPPPKKNYRPKTCKIWLNFGRLRTLKANISEMDEDIQYRASIWSTAIPPALGEKRCVNFGPGIWRSSSIIIPTQTEFFTFSGFPRGCCTSKFLHTLENDKVLLAHTPPGMWVPLTIFFKGVSKIH